MARIFKYKNWGTQLNTQFFYNSENRALPYGRVIGGRVNNNYKCALLAQ